MTVGKDFQPLTMSHRATPYIWQKCQNPGMAVYINAQQQFKNMDMGLLHYVRWSFQ